MAVSASKSTSRRSSTTTAPPPPFTAGGKPSPSTRQGRSSGDSTTKTNGQPRRSKSVSAFSTAHLDLDLDFTNKRENPLYWAADSPPSGGGGGGAKFDDAGSPGPRSKPQLAAGGEIRGRTVSRSRESKSDVGYDTGGRGGRSIGIGRSLSRVDTGRRRRSMSRGHYGRNFETERDQECNSTRGKSKSNVGDLDDKPLITRSNSDLAELLNEWQARSTKHPAEISDASALTQCSLFASRWEGGSVSSFSDAEERNLNPVSQLTKVIQRSNSSSSISTVVCSPPELVTPGEAEAVISVRGEYARKLEESQERSRKLRAELAIEEHRWVELNKILKEIVPYPETPDLKKNCAVRKASIEKKKVSRRLEEEAMAYFDECVSISTFDGSDFSSLEDPPALVNTTCISEPFQLANSVSRDSRTSVDNCSTPNPDPGRGGLILQSNGASPCTANSVRDDKCCYALISPNGSKGGWKRQFSFSDNGDDGSELKSEIRNYVKAFSRSGGGTGGSTQIHHNSDDYTLIVPREKLLLERMSLSNRMESGGLMLCGGEDLRFPF